MRTLQKIGIVVGSIVTVFSTFIITLFVIIFIADTNRPIEITIYSHSDTSMICNIFQFNEISDVCSNVENSREDVLSEIARIYPKNEMTYENIAELLNYLESRPSDNCERELEGNLNLAIYAEFNCPPPTMCKGNYTCTFDLPINNGNFTVYFSHPEGLVMQYWLPVSGTS